VKSGGFPHGTTVRTYSRGHERTCAPQLPLYAQDIYGSAGLEFVQVPQPDGKAGVPEKTLGIIGECADEGAADTLKALGCVSVYEVVGREEKE